MSHLLRNFSPFMIHRPPHGGRFLVPCLPALKRLTTGSRLKTGIPAKLRNGCWTAIRIEQTRQRRRSHDQKNGTNRAGHYFKLDRRGEGDQARHAGGLPSHDLLNVRWFGPWKTDSSARDRQDSTRSLLHVPRHRVNSLRASSHWGGKLRCSDWPRGEEAQHRLHPPVVESRQGGKACLALAENLG